MSQSYHAYEDYEWVAQDIGSATSGVDTSHSKFRVLIWNIDFQTQAQKQRMAVALRYLDELQEALKSRDEQ